MRRSKPKPPFEGTATGPTLWYAVVPRGIPFVNDGGLWVGEPGKLQLLTRASRLAITQNCVERGFELQLCDGHWRIRFSTRETSIRAAKRKAEHIYPGLAPHWVNLHVTKAMAKQYMKRLRAEQGCSFCRRAPAEHDGAQFEIASARICETCVREFHRNLSGA